MIEELALVVKVDKHRVWVASSQTGACGGCAQKAGCTTKAVASMLKKTPVPVEVDSFCRLAVGDTVVVGIDEGLLLLATLLMYLFPLAALFTGGGMVDWLLPDDFHAADSWIAVGAVVSLLLALWLVHYAQNLILFGFYTRPVVVKKL
ncbi:MAG: SoxR reducing system RseC family protein [Methylococcales bacterium]